MIKNKLIAKYLNGGPYVTYTYEKVPFKASTFLKRRSYSPLYYNVKTPEVISRSNDVEITPSNNVISQPTEEIISQPTDNSLLTNAISKYEGIPFVLGGKTNKGIDCSGFTSKVMLELGYNISGGSGNQWNLTDRVNTEDLLIGDLVFLHGTIKGRAKGLPSHVAIVTGIDDLKNGKITVAEASGRGKLSSNGITWDLNSDYFRNHWLGAGRIRK